jgi:hypothetical protein
VSTSEIALSETAPLYRISVRFIRVPHDFFGRSLKDYIDTEGDKVSPVDDAGKPPSFIKKHYLKPFSRIGKPTRSGGMSYSGVFMGGPRPCWVMMAGEGAPLTSLEVVEGSSNPDVAVDPPMNHTGKRALRIHPCVVDGEVLSFTEFHNINIPNGFVYMNGDGLLRLCQLLWQFNYDNDWGICKVPLRRTPHKITYHHHSETYTMAASTPTPFILTKAQHAAAVAAGVMEANEQLPELENKPQEDRSEFSTFI